MAALNCSGCKYDNESFEFPLCVTCKRKDKNGFLYHANWEPKILPLPSNEGSEKEEKEMSSMLSEYAAAVNKCNDAPEQVPELPSIARMAQTALNTLCDASNTLRSMECTVMGDKTLQSACTAASLQPENLTDNIKYILEAANNLNARLIELYAKIAD